MALPHTCHTIASWPQLRRGLKRYMAIKSLEKNMLETLGLRSPHQIIWPSLVIFSYILRIFSGHKLAFDNRIGVWKRFLPSLMVIFPRKNDDDAMFMALFKKKKHVSPSNPGWWKRLLGHLQGQAELRAERLLSEVLGSTERRHCFDVEKYLVGDPQNNQTVG